MALFAFQTALAQISALPLRREIKKATLERSVVNLCDCISMNSAPCRRKPPHSAASPAYGAGRAMGHTEADGGFVIGVREAWRLLTNSSRTSAGDGGRGSTEVLVSGSGLLSHNGSDTDM